MPENQSHRGSRPPPSWHIHAMRRKPRFLGYICLDACLNRFRRGSATSHNSFARLHFRKAAMCGNFLAACGKVGLDAFREYPYSARLMSDS
jgi:hypothetical protein